MYFGRQGATMPLHKWLSGRELGEGGCLGQASLKSSLCQDIYSSFRCLRMWSPQNSVCHMHHGGIFNFDFSLDGFVTKGSLCCVSHIVVMLCKVPNISVSHKYVTDRPHCSLVLINSKLKDFHGLTITCHIIHFGVTCCESLSES